MIILLKIFRLISLFYTICYSLLLGCLIVIGNIPALIVCVIGIGICIHMICDTTNEIMIIEFDNIITEIKNEIINNEIQKLKDSLK